MKYLTALFVLNESRTDSDAPVTAQEIMDYLKQLGQEDSDLSLADAEIAVEAYRRDQRMKSNGISAYKYSHVKA